MDTLLGLLVSECAYFGVQAESLAEALTNAEIPEAQRLQHTLAKLKDLPLPAMPKSKAEEEEEHEDAGAEGKGKEKYVFFLVFGLLFCSFVRSLDAKPNNSSIYVFFYLYLLHIRMEVVNNNSEDVPEEFTCPITHVSLPPATTTTQSVSQSISGLIYNNNLFFQFYFVSLVNFRR